MTQIGCRPPPLKMTTVGRSSMRSEIVLMICQAWSMSRQAPGFTSRSAKIAASRASCSSVPRPLLSRADPLVGLGAR